MRRTNRFDKIITAGGVAVIILTFLLVFSLSKVWAEDGDSCDSCESACGCLPTDEQIAQYEQDGSLEERVAFMENLGCNRIDESLLQSALARDSKQNETADSNSSLSEASTDSYAPTDWQSGMGTVGDARILAVVVDFADMSFADKDAEMAALHQQINDASGSASASYPYESLKGYYERSSYNKLHISGDVIYLRLDKNRSEYPNMQSFFKGAMEALDPQVDFTQYDANNDGLIDGVYLDYAGGNTGWGSQWWAYCDTYVYETSDPYITAESSEQQYLKTKKMVEFDAVLNTDSKTIIHETGHVLGLPDLYHYPSYPTVSSTRAGSRTWDMMDKNQGDLNGYFKWLLGWIDNESITSVCVNADGVVASRGGKEIARGTTYSEVLSSLVSSDLTQTGGFIKVSNTDKGMFSDFFLIEYEQTIQNNSALTYTAYSSEGQASTRAIPSGFRILSIRSELNNNGTDFLYSNTGTPDGAFLHALDADESAHQEISYRPSEYHCFLTPGNSFNSGTYPSTNIGESLESGFTGISLTVTDAQTDRGTIQITYDDKTKPAYDSFTITSDTTHIGLSPTLTLTPSSTPVSFDSSKVSAYLNDQPLTLSSKAVTYYQGTITAKLSLYESDVTSGDKVTIRFAEGAFNLGDYAGTTYYSKQIDVPFTVGWIASSDEQGEIAEIDNSELYATTKQSNMVTSGQSNYNVLTLYDKIRLNTYDSATLTRTNSTAISLPKQVLYEVSNGSKPTLYYMGNNLLFLEVKTNNGSYGIWIDASNADYITSQSFLRDGTTVATSLNGAYTRCRYSAMDSVPTSYLMKFSQNNGEVKESTLSIKGDSYALRAIASADNGTGSGSAEISVLLQSVNIQSNGVYTYKVFNVTALDLDKLYEKGNTASIADIEAIAESTILSFENEQQISGFSRTNDGRVLAWNGMQIYVYDAQMQAKASVTVEPLDVTQNTSLQSVSLSPDASAIAVTLYSDKQALFETTLIPYSSLKEGENITSSQCGSVITHQIWLGNVWKDSATYCSYLTKKGDSTNWLRYKGFCLPVSPDPKPDPTPDPQPIPGDNPNATSESSTTPKATASTKDSTGALTTLLLTSSVISLAILVRRKNRI